jgi:ribonuclease P protein component
MTTSFGPDVRLRSHREFAAAQKRGRRIPARLFTLLALPNTLGRDRLGVIASRRLGGAVVRNRAKRRVRALFRDCRSQAAGRRTFDLVVIPRRELADAPFPVLQADFRTAVEKLRAVRAS